MREPMDVADIEEFCARRPRWSQDPARLVGSAQADSFAQAIRWVNRIAAAAEAIDHHPDIDIRWNKVSFALSTHSAGGITPLDFELATAIDVAASKIIGG